MEQCYSVEFLRLLIISRQLIIRECRGNDDILVPILRPIKQLDRIELSTGAGVDALQISSTQGVAPADFTDKYSVRAFRALAKRPVAGVGGF